MINGIKLPAPRTKDEEWEYVPLVRVGNIVPWGYEQDPNDPDIILPIKKELELLRQAREHLHNGYSYRDVAAWLSENSGRYISHSGLRDRLRNEQRKNQRGANLKQLIARLEAAVKKAERFEATAFGKQKKVTSKTEDETD